MSKLNQNNRVVWLVVGVLAGLLVSSFTPKQPLLAVATDRDDKFAMTTVDLTGNIGIEGIFILDFLTGTLRGGALNRQNGKFQFAYQRNIAQDFNVDPKAEPHYALVSGRVGMPSARGTTPAAGVVYVAELSSGTVVAYTFPYRETSRGSGMAELTPLDIFQFREASE